MRIKKEHVIFEMNKDNVPALKADSGSTVTFETMDCFSDTVKTSADVVSTVDFSKINPATGPLYMNGAEPGDTLKVTINKIELNNQGAAIASPGLGQFGDETTEEETAICEVRENTVMFNGIEMPLRKMVGVIGTAPAGQGVNTGTPHDHGGNLDTTLITEGSSLYLPVNVSGGLLAMGDCHASMGDGEVNGAGIEIAAEVEVTVEVLKDFHHQLPMVETADKWAALGSRETMEEAVKLALDNMKGFIMKRTKLTANQTYMLLSIAADVKACQIVNPNYTMRVEISKDLLNQQ